MTRVIVSRYAYQSIADGGGGRMLEMWGHPELGLTSLPYWELLMELCLDGL